MTEQPPAFDMTVKLEEKLQEILAKLEKLAAIETSVKILQEKLAGMDSGIQSLESATQASAYRDINDLKDSGSFYVYKQQTSLQMSELGKKKHPAKLQNLKTKIYLEA